jgi:crotonobetainyl-CoA:carnitine CoA-transferase CaiB-like acyl-CoA transferase
VPPSHGPGPLEGVRVLDFSRVYSGPHCGRVLADLGADVVKIEPPAGDLSRFLGPRSGSMSRYHAQQNAGKRNISLDLTRPEARDILSRLVEGADVLLENFRPGVMARFGLGYDEVAAVNPRLVYASLTGWGQDGPWAGRRAYAVIVHAEAGLTAGLIARGAEPRNDGFSHADVYTGLECAIGILAALHQRQRTGRGQHVDVAMAASLLAVNEHAANELADAGVAPGPRLLRTRDGQYATTSADPWVPGSFQLFCKAMDRPDLLTDERFAEDDVRARNRDALFEIVSEWAASFDTATDLEAALSGVRLPVGVLRSVAELAATEWAEDRGAITDVADRSGGTIRLPSAPWRFTDADAGVRRDPAWRGEHNHEVLREVGFSDDDIARLEADGVLSNRPPRS